MGSSPPLCESLPPLVSSFIDAFVDYTVSGIFLPTPDSKSSSNHPSFPQKQSTRIDPPGRVVAIGDLHGDLSKARQALSVAGVLDLSTNSWVGGDTVAVQVGDVMDGGGNEIQILYLLQRLKTQAARSGGALVTLLGNHETMNLQKDFCRATPEGLAEFESWGRWYRTGIAMKTLCHGLERPADPFARIPKRFEGLKRECWKGIRARIAAFEPDGPLARRFMTASQAVVLVGDSVFVHGGLLTRHVENYSLEEINDEAHEWVSRRRRQPLYLDSVLGTRQYSDCLKFECGDIEKVLAKIFAARMVMGHSIQGSGVINGVCGDRAIRIDVGLSRERRDGLPQVLEISGGQLRVLSALPNGEMYRRHGWPAVARRGNEEKKGLASVIVDGNRPPTKAEVKA